MLFDLMNGLSFRVLESVGSAIVISDATDPEHPIVYVNPAFETLTGYGPEESIGKNCRFLQGQDTDQPERDHIRNMLNQGLPMTAVLRNYRKDGSLFYNEICISPVRNSVGQITHFTGCQTRIANPEGAAVRQRALVGMNDLTNRESEVFTLVTSGHTNKSIARKLEISPRTVEKHRTAVLNKFEVSNPTLLVRYAIALGTTFEPPESLLS